jgi:hypothetical protein
MTAPGAANPLMISPVTSSGLNPSINGGARSHAANPAIIQTWRPASPGQIDMYAFLCPAHLGLAPKQERGNVTCSMVVTVSAQIRR